MQADKQEVLKRLNYIEGHLGGIRKMIEEDKYCVDILRQTYAVRKAIEKLEGLLVESHLHTCVPEGIASGKSDRRTGPALQPGGQSLRSRGEEQTYGKCTRGDPFRSRREL
jgi:DNA-binding FrmR family transcriptional regulator